MNSVFIKLTITILIILINCAKMNLITERYEKCERLGEGTYGVVFKARDIIQKDYVALKKIKL